MGNLSKIIEQHLPGMQNHQVESSHRTEKVTINELPGSQSPHQMGLLELSPTVRFKKKKHLLKKSSFQGSSVTPFSEQVTCYYVSDSFHAAEVCVSEGGRDAHLGSLPGRKLMWRYGKVFICLPIRLLLRRKRDPSHRNPDFGTVAAWLSTTD